MEILAAILPLLLLMGLGAALLSKAYKLEQRVGLSLNCPPHAWKWTESGPGRVSVLRCQTCTLIFGPVDEHGRKNPNFDPPRGTP